MKNIYISAFVLGMVFIGCHTTNKSNTPAQHTRNTAITAANAYNTIFIDSAALENFITAQKMDDSTAQRMRGFYLDRNYTFAWFDTAGLCEQGRGFWNLINYSVTSLKDSSAFSRALAKRMPDITMAENITVSSTDTAYIKTELMLTTAFIQYIKANNAAMTDEEMNRYVPAQKSALAQAAADVLKNESEPAMNDAAANAYRLLKKQLQKYYSIMGKAGWQSIPFTHTKYANGSSAPAITAVKKRLLVTNEYTGNDTSAVFNALLDTAVRRFQAELGYTPDGIITDSLVKYMNIPAEKWVEKILINLNRLKWMPEPVKGRLIVANIPEYELHVYEDNKKAFDMDIIVGKEGAGTVIFTGNLTEIVFSPYWNIPPSITQKEIVPKMKADKSYMRRERLEITGYSNGLPVVRQLPGKKNSLGTVKFLFHNSYNIYFHDTPQKGLFSKDKRAYSHGCIRLADPVKMANYLLDDSKKWTPENITSAMNGGKEKYVTLKKSVAVIISYYTAWVNEEGRFNFKEDIYGHDATTAEKMFIAAK